MTQSERELATAAAVAGVLEALYRQKIGTLADLLQQVVLRAPHCVPALVAEMTRILDKHPVRPVSDVALPSKIRVR